MIRYLFYALLLFLAFRTPAYSQKIILKDDFKNNKNGWKLQHDSSFRVDIKNGVLHVEKFKKNFISRGCLWYQKSIPGFNTQNDFSMTIYAKFLSGGDIIDMIDFQWGQREKVVKGKLSSRLYQLSFMMNGEVKLDYFDKGWTYFVRKKIKTLLGNEFDPKRINKYELEQKDSFIVFKVNNQEVLRQFYHPVAGNSIGFQQCLKTAWEIDKIVVRQQPKKKAAIADSTRSASIKPSEVTYLSDQELKVYPNPFVHNLSVAINLEKEENVQFSLVDMNGNIWQQHNRKLSAGIQHLQMYADVAPGSYVLKVQMGKRVLSAKVIRQ